MSPLQRPGGTNHYLHRIYRFLGSGFRDRRMVRFLELIGDVQNPLILDVGGDPATWAHEQRQSLQVHLLNKAFAGDTFADNLIKVIGDARHLPFGINAYSACFSNSVIEHVGSWADQRAFAGEIRRISRLVWVQTPSRRCPVEPHYLTLFLHWTPRNFQKRCLRFLSVWGLLTKPDQATIDRIVNEVRLLSKKEMVTLFPDCKILTERLFGIFPKSYVAVRTEPGYLPTSDLH